MGIKRHKPEEIVTKLRQVELLVGQGMARIEAIRQISIAEQTYYRWCQRYACLLYLLIYIAKMAYKLFAHLTTPRIVTFLT
jgi:hypothetical protein